MVLQLEENIILKCNICEQEFQSYKELTKHLVNKHQCTRQQLYDYFNYSFETMSAKCPVCGKEFTISANQRRAYRKKPHSVFGCCPSCTASLRSAFFGSPFSNPEVREKSKQTMLERYGEESSLKSEKIQKKAKETLLEKYGVDNIQKLPEVREKMKKTCIKRYGVEHPAQSEEVKEKIKQTNLKKFGTVAPAQSKEVKEKMKQTNLKRFSVENASQASEIKEKKKETFLKNYGVKSPFQIPGIKEKIPEKTRKTNLEKYGVEYPVQAEQFKEQMKQTNLDRYGFEYTVKVPEFQEKTKQTNLERYGVENAFQNEEIREKAKQTNLEKYGKEFASQSEEVKDRIKESNLKNHGIEYFCQHPDCFKASQRISKVNKKFHEILNENGIENELEFIVENYGYDLRVENTLIEINPFVTHNSTWGPRFGSTQKSPKPRDYHLQKTNFAKEHGFHCIHIFDWDDSDKIVEMLKPKTQVYARNCTVKEIKRKIADVFLGNYHLQGSTKQLQHAYGLFYKDELVQVMTFGKPRYNKNYEYELLRLCTIPGVSVTGGASKILKYFENQVKPESIISYCDLSKFNGSVYNTLGFKLVNQTAPTKHWYNDKTKMHITDNLLRQRGFDQLHKTNFGKGTSNEELMKEHGYVEIYDCGQLVFEKTVN